MSDFDPSKHLRQLKGRGGTADYLDVKWRLVWLRAEHPDAQIDSDKTEGGIESNYAVFKARVTIPGGGSATGWGSETKADFGDFLEKAETKAIGRALAALGYGTQFAPELDEGERIADSPVERRPQPVPAHSQAARPAPPAAVAPDDAALITRVCNDLLTPDERWDALWDYYDRATDVADLNRRAEQVKASGVPERDLRAAYKQKHSALAQTFGLAGGAQTA